MQHRPCRRPPCRIEALLSMAIEAFSKVEAFHRPVETFPAKSDYGALSSPISPNWTGLVFVFAFVFVFGATLGAGAPAGRSSPGRPIRAIKTVRSDPGFVLLAPSHSLR